MRQLMAAWMVLDERDFPMNPRLLGKPGVGKTTMAYAAAKRLGREEFTALQASKRTGLLYCRLNGDRVVLGGHCQTVIVGQFQL